MKTILSIIGLLALCALEFFLARRGKKWLGWFLPILSFLGSTAFYVCNLRMPEGGSRGQLPADGGARFFPEQYPDAHSAGGLFRRARKTG